MRFHTIKDLERLTGVKAHTIRIWEQRYNLLTPERTDTNIRTYSDNELKKLINVSFLINNGYKISKISNLSDIEINSITPFMKFFFVFIVFSYLFGFTILLVISFKDTNFAFFPIPFLIVHAAFMIGIPFFIIKSSVKHFKQEMEREFHFWLR